MLFYVTLCIFFVILWGFVCSDLIYCSRTVNHIYIWISFKILGGHLFKTCEKTEITEMQVLKVEIGL